MLFSKHGDRSHDERGYDEFDFYGDEPIFYDEAEFFNFTDSMNQYRIENVKQKKKQIKSRFSKKK